MLDIWWALFFMFLGGAIVGFFDMRVWKKYYEGKREGEALWRSRK